MNRTLIALIAFTCCLGSFSFAEGEEELNLSDGIADDYSPYSFCATFSDAPECFGQRYYDPYSYYPNYGAMYFDDYGYEPYGYGDYGYGYGGYGHGYRRGGWHGRHSDHHRNRDSHNRHQSHSSGQKNYGWKHGKNR